MSNNYFFTGFPGFIATSLIRQIIKEHHAIERISLLVQPDLLHRAQQEMDKITQEFNISSTIFTIIEGDITKSNLAISLPISRSLQKSVTHVFHLAAIYNLAVPHDIAYKVNVIGTHHVNQWVQQLNKLQRYIYFSTAYVSGTREGKIYETELRMNQTFKNHYESTKYEAEVLVEQIKNKVPTTIIRPGIVRGHSRTGETAKFDGVYFILNTLDKFKFSPLIPYLGKGRADGNFVPVDYIFDASIYLSHNSIGAGKTYHLTDPNPYPIKEVYRMLMEKYLNKKPIGIIPLSWVKHSLAITPLRKWLGVEKESTNYFTCLSYYDSTQAQNDLRDSGIICPDFSETIDAMVSYYSKHKEDADKRIYIR